VRRIVALLLVPVLASACGTPPPDGAQAAAATAAQSAGPQTGAPVSREVRIQEPQEGWAIDVPASWHDERTVIPAMHILRSFEGTGTGLIPQPGGVAVAIQVMYDREGLDLEAFADRFVWVATCRPCREIRERGDLTLAGQSAKLFSVWQSQPQVLQDLEPNLWWLVRSAFAPERIVVIHMVPAASPLRATVEQMVLSLRLFQPTPADLTPTKSRSQVIAEITHTWNVTKAAAKATSWREFEDSFNAHQRATNPTGPGPFHSSVAPDTLVWLVAYTGSGFTPTKGGPPGPGSTGTPATPTPWGWGISVVPARAPFTWTGPGLGGPESSWPTWFDALRDLAP